MAPLADHEAPVPPCLPHPEDFRPPPGYFYCIHCDLLTAGWVRTCKRCNHSHNSREGSLVNTGECTGCRFYIFRAYYTCWSCLRCQIVDSFSPSLELGDSFNRINACPGCHFPIDSSWVVVWRSIMLIPQGPNEWMLVSRTGDSWDWPWHRDEQMFDEPYITEEVKEFWKSFNEA